MNRFTLALNATLTLSLLAGLCACDAGSQGRSTGSSYGTPYGGESALRTDAAEPRGNSDARWTETSTSTSRGADHRILSILHAKNQEEVSMGRLADERGQSAETRQYGRDLVKDHQEADTKVLMLASSNGNTSLMPTQEVGKMLADEKGKRYEPDPTSHLRNLSSTDFDRTFASHMRDGHRDLRMMLENVRGQVGAQTRSLIDELLPVIRRHEQTAAKIAGGR